MRDGWDASRRSVASGEEHTKGKQKTHLIPFQNARDQIVREIPHFTAWHTAGNTTIGDCRRPKSTWSLYGLDVVGESQGIGDCIRRRIWLCTIPTDMRRSFDGLSALVRNELGADPTSGNWFVFVNRRRTMMKVLAFDGDGYWIWSKRLVRQANWCECSR